MPQVTGTTSATGAQAILPLNPVPKSTFITLVSTGTFAAGSSNSTIQLEATTVDINAFGAPTATWALVSSAAAMVSSAVQNTTLSYEFLGPLAGVRMNVIVASTGAAMSFTLAALQSVTA